jgi:hypothetical protein
MSAFPTLVGKGTSISGCRGVAIYEYAPWSSLLRPLAKPGCASHAIASPAAEPACDHVPAAGEYRSGNAGGLPQQNVIRRESQMLSGRRDFLAGTAGLAAIAGIKEER